MKWTELTCHAFFPLVMISDIMSLGPPDGKFLTAFQSALQVLAEKSKTKETPIVVRMLFGNIAGKFLLGIIIVHMMCSKPCIIQSLTLIHENVILQACLLIAMELSRL